MMDTPLKDQRVYLETKSNFQSHCLNPYPGSGIVAGLDETGEYMAQVYWIMGQNESSRKRVLKADNETGRLYTEAADLSKVINPSPIIYNAMNEKIPFYVVSNGDQTDTVIDRLDRGPFSLESALDHREYEHDTPNFTQRITAVNRLCKGRECVCYMSILRKSRFRGRSESSTYQLSLAPGFGHCITTYAGDGDPLPPFRGNPLLMPLIGGMEEIAHTYWNALNGANRVSLAIKWIEIANGRSDIHIINKYDQV